MPRYLTAKYWIGLGYIALGTAWTFRLANVVEVDKRLITARWEFRGEIHKIPLVELQNFKMSEESIHISLKDESVVEIPIDKFSRGEFTRFITDLEYFLRTRIWPRRKHAA